MKQTLLLLGVLLSMLLTGGAFGQDATRGTVERGAPRQPEPRADGGVDSSGAKTTDDLDWLVGRWKCVTRQYFTKQEQLLAGRGEDSLEYFNVYFPYADDQLTLVLGEDPDRRPIAAEFVVRYVDDTGSFNEELAPMSPGGTVRIGRNRIWYGSPPANDFEFRYSVERRGHRLWLVLESRHVRLGLLKLHAGVGDIRKSFVKAPIRDYSPERVKGLATEYEHLKKGAAQKDGSQTQERPAPKSP